jgi:4-carboxymuconolactone decarboxylase
MRYLTMTTPPEPRLTPIPFAEWDEHTRSVLLPHLRRPERYLSGAPDAPPMPVVMELFAHHLPVSARMLALTDVLAGDDARLDPRLREMAILRVAWRTGSGYEWGQHSRMARDEGVTDIELAAVTEGPAAAAWAPLERTLLTAVDEMIDGYEVGTATWDGLAVALEASEVFELLFVIGSYLCLAGVLNSLGLRGDPPAVP